MEGASRMGNHTHNLGRKISGKVYAYENSIKIDIRKTISCENCGFNWTNIGSNFSLLLTQQCTRTLASYNSYFSNKLNKYRLLLKKQYFRVKECKKFNQWMNNLTYRIDKMEWWTINFGNKMRRGISLWLS